MKHLNPSEALDFLARAEINQMVTDIRTACCQVVFNAGWHETNSAVDRDVICDEILFALDAVKNEFKRLKRNNARKLKKEQNVNSDSEK